jgi:hypothetical protein
MRHYPVNHDVFLDENANSFYLLGAYMTDGCMCYTIHKRQYKGSAKTYRYWLASLTSNDVDWLETIRDTIVPDKKLNKRKGSEGQSLAFTDDTACDWLRSYGCVPNKSKTAKLLKTIPKKFRADFMRGVLDGDGCISFYTQNKKRVDGSTRQYQYLETYICTASKKFLNQLIEMLPPDINYGVRTKKPKTIYSKSLDRKIRATGNIYYLTITGKYARKLLAWLYYPKHELSLPRKAKKAKEHSAI